MTSTIDEKSPDGLKPNKASLWQDSSSAEKTRKTCLTDAKEKDIWDKCFEDQINWDELNFATSGQDLFSKVSSQTTRSNGVMVACETSKRKPRCTSMPSPTMGTRRDVSYKHYPMTKISDSVYLGNDHDACNRKVLRAEKITHILSMVGRKFSPSGSRGIKRKCVPMHDGGNSDVVKLLGDRGILDFMEESQKKKNKLLVHCQLGQNRSPTIVMAFLMKYHGMTLYRAWREVKQKRIIVQPNENYIKQLRVWDMYLHGRHSTPNDFLNMSIDDEKIMLVHENTNTQRMKLVLANSTAKMRQSYLESAQTETDDLDIDNLEDIDRFFSPSPKDFASLKSSTKDIGNQPTETYEES